MTFDAQLDDGEESDAKEYMYSREADGHEAQQVQLVSQTTLVLPLSSSSVNVRPASVKHGSQRRGCGGSLSISHCDSPKKSHQ